MNLFNDPDRDESRAPSTFPRIAALVLGVITLLLVLFLTPRLVETLDARQVMVIQSLSGSLNCYTEPGPYWQGLGTVTTFPRRSTYTFDTHEVRDKVVVRDDGKQIQFAEGGKASIYGQINWEMPLDCKQIVEIFRTFGSKDGIEQQGVARMVNTAIQLSGSTMNSLQSFAERKGELVEYINDQSQNGAYKMTTKMEEQLDPVTNQKKMVSVAEIVRDSKTGVAQRQHGSILEQYGIHLQPMSVERIAYSPDVEAQIVARQKATNEVQVSQTTALKAIQDAITAEEQGKATAAKAKWAQEAIKATAVTEAQQKLEVATFAAKEAEAYKREQVLRGEGDAERRRLVLAADGALDSKLEAYKHVMGLWAGAFKDFKGTLVPQVSMGGVAGGANAMSSTQDLLGLLSAKTARDLAVDLSNTGAGATAKKQ